MKNKVLLMLTSLVALLLCSFTTVETYENSSQEYAKQLDDKYQTTIFTNLNSEINFDNKKSQIENITLYDNMDTDFENELLENTDHIIIAYDYNNRYYNYDCVICINNDGNIKTKYYNQIDKSDIQINIYTLKNFIFTTLDNYLCNTYLNIIDNQITIDCSNKGRIRMILKYSIVDSYNNKSLYLISPQIEFTPGAAAQSNGQNYDDYKLLDGYVHLTPSTAYSNQVEYGESFRYGAHPVYQDVWPLSSPSDVEIDYNFEGSVSGGCSKEDGLYIDGKLVFKYNKKITYTNPKVSAQTSQKTISHRDSNYYGEKDQNGYVYENVTEAEWNYEHADMSTQTFRQDCNYLLYLEDFKDLFKGDMRLTFDLKMVLDKGFWTKRQVYYETVDLILRPSFTGDQFFDFANGSF